MPTHWRNARAKLFSLRKPTAAATCLTGLPVRSSRSRARSSAPRPSAAAGSRLPPSAGGAACAPTRAAAAAMRLGAVRALRMRRERLPHLRHQQAVAPVLQHGERQRALASICVQRLLVAAQRQLQVAAHRSGSPPARAPNAQRAAREHVAHRRRHAAARGNGKRARLQRDARIDVPAGQAVDVAQHVKARRQLARLGRQRPALLQRDDGARRAADRQRQLRCRRSSRPWWRHQRLSATPRSGAPSEARASMP